MVLDIETMLNEAMMAAMTGPQLLHYAEEFTGTVAEKTGRDVMTYLSPGLMPELGNTAPKHGEDVWVAAFSFQPGKPPTPQGFDRNRVRAHQFSEHGTFAGVATEVDLDQGDRLADHGGRRPRTADDAGDQGLSARLRR
jgi:GH25 family lysozyme M1 (1,4-beta-N-acetylmuramidase)